METESWEDGDGDQGLNEELTESLEALGNILGSWEQLVSLHLEAAWKHSPVRQVLVRVMQSHSSSYCQACECLRHVHELVRALPRRASDGTTVWDDAEAAVTNEPEQHDQVAGHEENSDGVGGHRVDQGDVRHMAGSFDGRVLLRSVRESKAEAELRRQKTQAAAREKRRLAELRKTKPRRRARK